MSAPSRARTEDPLIKRRPLYQVPTSHQTLEYKDSNPPHEIVQLRASARIETQSKTVVHTEFLRIPPYDLLTVRSSSGREMRAILECFALRTSRAGSDWNGQH